MQDRDPEIELVLAAYAAFARGDVDQAVAHLHANVDWLEPDEFPYGGRMTGPDAVADYLRKSRALWAELVSEPVAQRRGRDVVVVHQLRGQLADGTPRTATVADVFTFEDGVVIRMQAYADPGEVP